MAEDDRDPLLDLDRETQIDLLTVSDGMSRALVGWASAAAREGRLKELLAAFLAGDGWFMMNRNRFSMACERPPTGDMVPDDISGLE